MASLTSEIRETKSEVAYLRKENADLRVLVEEIHLFLIVNNVEGIQVRNEVPENTKEYQQGGDESCSLDAAEPEKKCM
eukprot:14564558-Ditylum_brightwellii.AAC.2